MRATSRPRRTGERLVVLETEVDTIRGVQQVILAKQEEILAELARYRGAFGMALLIFSAIGTAMLFLKDIVLAKLGLKG